MIKNKLRLMIVAAGALGLAFCQANAPMPLTNKSDSPDFLSLLTNEEKLQMENLQLQYRLIVTEDAAKRQNLQIELNAYLAKTQSSHPGGSDYSIILNTQTNSLVWQKRATPPVIPVKEKEKTPAGEKVPVKK